MSDLTAEDFPGRDPLLMPGRKGGTNVFVMDGADPAEIKELFCGQKVVVEKCNQMVVAL